MTQFSCWYLRKLCFTLTAVLVGLSISVHGEQRGTIQILSMDYPPYEFAEPVNGLKGFDVEVIEEAFRRVGVSIEIKFVPWKRGVETVIRGLAPALLTCARSAKRDPYIHYSEPLSRSTETFFVRKEYQGPPLTSHEAARGRKIGAVLDYSFNENLDSLKIKYRTYRTENLALRDLLAGVIDVYLTPREGTTYMARQWGVTAKLRGFDIQSTTLFLCFSKKWYGVEELMLNFNHGLSEVKKDGTYDRIHDKYK